MNTSELRNSVIAKINEIHDNDFLLAIKTIIESKTSKEYPDLQSYNDDILKAEEDIKNGYLSSHDEVKIKMEEWKKR